VSGALQIDGAAFNPTECWSGARYGAGDLLRRMIVPTQTGRAEAHTIAGHVEFDYCH
jgi:hypothetical protein